MADVLRLPLRETDPNRGLFEDAQRHKNKSRLLNIQLDLSVRLIQSHFLSNTLTEAECIDQLDQLTYSEDELSKRVGATDDWTDFMRVVTASVFMKERTLVPVMLTAGESNEKIARVTDDINGKSLELIESVFDIIDGIDQYEKSTEVSSSSEVKEVRGWIQEMTAMVLINYAHDPNLVALPSSILDDLKNKTDLLLYIRDGTEVQLRRISVKSSTYDARQEELAAPYRTVISSADFDNKDLSTTRLLMREFAGAPGINPTERSQLERSRENLMSIIMKSNGDLEPLTEQQSGYL